MKILITGGCGFLGSNLAHESIANGSHEILIIDNLSRIGSSENLSWLKETGEFRFERVDIRNAEKIEGIIKEFQPGAIFHLAGQVAMTTSISEPRRDFETNALGTINVLEGVRKNDSSCVVIYSSTNKVYGDLEWVTYQETATRYVAPEFPTGFNEQIPLSFHSPYGCSKGSADQYVLDYHRIYGIRTAVFRHSSMYGGRQFPTVDQGWIGWFCQQAMEAKLGRLRSPLTISGNGKQVRDVLYADDMIGFYYGALAKSELIQGQVFNLGGGMDNSLSLIELFEILSDEIGLELTYESLPPRASDQKVFVADIQKAERLIGFRPRVGKLDGIRHMVEWLGEHVRPN